MGNEEWEPGSEVEYSLHSIHLQMEVVSLCGEREGRKEGGREGGRREGGRERGKEGGRKGERKGEKEGGREGGEGRREEGGAVHPLHSNLLHFNLLRYSSQSSLDYP